MNPINICVIGDSHLAALKLGYDNLDDEFKDVKLTFFGSFASSFNELKLKDNALVPVSNQVKKRMRMTSGGLGYIPLENYDIFILHGLELSFHNFVRKGLSNLKTSHMVQLQTAEWQSVTHYINQTLSFRLANKISISNKPILLSPQPFLSEEIVNSANSKYEFWRKLVGKNNMNTQTEIKAALTAWLNHLQQFNFIEQLPSTICQDFFSKNEYSSNSVMMFDMASKHGSEDIVHMNPKYGELVIRTIINRCREIAQDSTDALNKNNLLIKSIPTKQNPYVNLPDRSYWRRTIGNKQPIEITDWYRKKFEISSLPIASAGSCFAQHIGRRLRQKGFNYLDVEPAPSTLNRESHLDYGYGMYSARYGNLYTTRQLLQLFQRAFGEFTPKDIFWEKDGGYVDPFRPTIQPQPFSTIEELQYSRKLHFEAVQRLFLETKVFIFTLGLTETWLNTEDGSVFPIAPGVSGGKYDADKYRFVNLTCNEVLADMRQFISSVHRINPTMKLILTVSPVPLMATASHQQIVVATTYSKSVLRAVAGQLAENRKNVDYFPSFEIINSHVMKSTFYEDDMRSVLEKGVDFVMENFFSEHQPMTTSFSTEEPSKNDDDIICDEELLAAFGKK
jgi:hypothetical protein